MARGIQLMDVVILGGAYFIAKKQGWLDQLFAVVGGGAPKDPAVPAVPAVPAEPVAGGGKCSAGDYAMIDKRRYIDHPGATWNVVFGGAVIGQYSTQSAAEQAYNAAVERKCGGGA